MSKFLPYVELGNPKASRAMVFVSGFPDNQLSAFKRVFPYFEKEFRIIAMCFPDFELSPGSDQTVENDWGYSFDEILRRMDATIDKISRGKKVILVTHDWGAHLGYLYENRHPEKIEVIVAHDVAMLTRGRPSLPALLILVLYQWWFTTSFLVKNIFGKSAGDFVLSSYVLLTKLLPFIGPTRDKLRRPREEITSHLCYPYAHFWLWGGITMKTRYPKCPLLYMYGRNKNIMFHNASTLERIKSDKNASYREFKGGHWFFDEEPEQVVEEIKKFLEKNADTLRKG